MIELLSEEKPERGLPRSKQSGSTTTKSESSEATLAASSRLTRERERERMISPFYDGIHN